MELAVAHVIDLARSTIRGRVLLAEQRAEQARRCREAEERRRAGLWKGRYRHGSHAKQDGAAWRGCPCQACGDARQFEKDWAAKRSAALSKVIDDYAAELRMEWTADYWPRPSPSTPAERP